MKTKLFFTFFIGLLIGMFIMASKYDSGTNLTINEVNYPDHPITIIPEQPILPNYIDVGIGTYFGSH